MSSYSNNYRNGFEGGDIEFNVVKRLGILNNYNTGWTKEANIISWNQSPAKLDIRDWDPEHEHMSKGITLYEEEAIKLLRVLKTQFEDPKEGAQVNGSGWDTAKRSGDFAELERQAKEEREERLKKEEEEREAVEAAQMIEAENEIVGIDEANEADDGIEIDTDEADDEGDLI